MMVPTSKHRMMKSKEPNEFYFCCFLISAIYFSPQQRFIKVSVKITRERNIIIPEDKMIIRREFKKSWKLKRHWVQPDELIFFFALFTG